MLIILDKDGHISDQITGYK